MPGCSVIKCRSQGKGLHTFPAVPALRRQWILFCKRSPEWTPGPSARLCNDHFRPSDLKSWSGRVKDTAVPSIFERCSRSATETSAKRKKVGVRTNGDNKSFVPRNNNGKSSVPVFCDQFMARQEILPGSSVG
jgi:hypothetical protein